MKERYISMRAFFTLVRNKLEYEKLRHKKKRNLNKLKKSKVSVCSIDETIAYLVENNASLARFGDGEIDLIMEQSIHFQTASPELSRKMQAVINSHGQDPRMMIAIPDIMNYGAVFRPKAKNFWDEYLSLNAGKWLKYLKKDIPYFNAHVTRLYMDWADKSQTPGWYQAIKKVWDGRKVLIIEGEKSRLGVGNDLFDNVADLKRILCPNRNAYAHYDAVLQQVKQFDRSTLILLALGPTATIMAYDLHHVGFQAVDVGHIDIEYSWFLAGAVEKQHVPGKYIAESKGGGVVADIYDSVYEAQILGRYGC